MKIDGTAHSPSCRFSLLSAPAHLAYDDAFRSLSGLGYE